MSPFLLFSYVLTGYGAGGDGFLIYCYSGAFDTTAAAAGINLGSSTFSTSAEFSFAFCSFLRASSLAISSSNRFYFWSRSQVVVSIV